MQFHRLRKPPALGVGGRSHSLTSCTPTGRAHKLGKMCLAWGPYFSRIWQSIGQISSFEIEKKDKFVRLDHIFYFRQLRSKISSNVLIENTNRLFVIILCLLAVRIEDWKGMPYRKLVLLALEVVSAKRGT